MSILSRGLLTAAISGVFFNASANQPAGNLLEPQPPITLTNAMGQSARWTGVGRLSSTDGRQCIASLIDTRGGAQPLDGPAYIVTSGHCVDKRHGVILQDQPISATVSFNYFVDTLDQRQPLPVKRVVWSSMQGIDLALLELDSTLGQVMAQGIEPLALGASPTPGSAVYVVGEPSSPDLGLRLSHCNEENADVVVEQPWVWRQVKRNSCLGMAAGASGSAVVEVTSGKLVSVVNSVAVNYQGALPCTPNNPCQPGDGAATLDTLRNSAMPVQRLLGCFSAAKADLNGEGCSLLPAFQLEQLTPPRTVAKIASPSEGQAPLPTWGLTFKLDTPRYRYKATRDALECENPVGYSGTIPASEASIDDAYGPEPGWHYLCVIGVESPEHLPTRALMANSLSIPTLLLPTGLPVPSLTLEHTTDSGIDVTWHLSPPDLILYRIKRGAPDKVDCDDPAGYRALAGRSQRIRAAQLPLKLCTKAFDLLRQSSAPRTDVLEARTR
ncbi:trypsin-like peptidase domain-containing protein [Pseudomonas sichuanensis]|uniref:trypsin-like peptidase domain-containing protein n=1 Tax=Pseudomonas TaxID=286 RepID=UPI0036ED056F